MKKIIFGTLAASMLLGSAAQASLASWHLRLHGADMTEVVWNVSKAVGGDPNSHHAVINTLAKAGDWFDDALPGGVKEAKQTIKEIAHSVRYDERTGLDKAAVIYVATKSKQVALEKVGTAKGLFQ